MSGYSSIFASGLLATPRPNAYSDHSTRSYPDSPVNMDSDPDTTPTKLNTLPIPSSEEAMNYFMPRSRASSNASATSAVLSAAPRLRRRRSSLSVANNGLAAVKSPQRSAGIALQRNSLMVPGARARSGSIDGGPTGIPHADDGVYVLASSRTGGGRSRSGSSSGTTIRPRRALRKPLPPPSTPLPPPPTPVVAMEVVHRRPLVHRTHTTENFSAIPRTDVASSVCLAPALDLMNNLKIAAALGTPAPSSSPPAELSALWGSGVRTNEN